MTDLPQRHILPVEPSALFERLPGLGKLMMFTTNAHVTHERIGRVETVEEAGGWTLFKGHAHDSRIRLAAVRQIVVDRSRSMGEKSYPRIELNGDHGEIACIVGFEGLEPFDQALDGLPVGESVEQRETIFNTMPRDQNVDPNEPGFLPLEQARRDSVQAVLEIAHEDFRQRWTGMIPELRVSLGFINIIEPDFHLHMRGGSIARWDSATVDGASRFSAVGRDGSDLGFSVTLG